MKFDPELFRNYMSGTVLDELLCSYKGLPKGVNYMIIGDPGVGKTTIILDLLSNIRKCNTGVTEFIIVGLRRKSAENMGKPQRGSHRRFFLRSCSGQSPDSVSIARVLRTLTRPRGMPSSSAALSTKELESSMKYAP